MLLPLLLLSLSLSPVAGEAYNSVTHLRALAGAEEAMSGAITSYLARRGTDIVPEEKEELERFVAEASADSELSETEHPVSAYCIVRRWLGLTQTHGFIRSVGYRQLVKLHGLGKYLPEAGELEKAANGLLRLQKTYLLDSPELAQGTVSGHPSSGRLQASDLLLLGSRALNMTDHAAAATWLRLATQHAHSQAAPEVEARAWLQLSRAYARMGNSEAAAQAYETASEVADAITSLSGTSVQGLVPEPDISFEDGTTSNTPETYEQYRALCRGETLYRAPAVLSSLVCQYRRGVLPYSVYREEVVSWTPRISIYHNIISHREAAKIKDIVHKKLQKSPAMVGGYKDTVLTRRSQHLWDQLLANGHYNVTFLSQRVADMTGLDTRFSYKSTAADPWSISDYGIGGQFEPHVDYYEDAEDLDKNLPDYMVGSGDRIITSVFYLSTPKAGGGTVFPWVNVTVNAVEGNAAVWYNYHPSGEPDWDTRHAGCPVLLGEKWVAIKWVRQTAQWATKPCGLTQQEAWPRQ